MTVHAGGWLSRYFAKPFSGVWRAVILGVALGGALISGCGSSGNSSPVPPAHGSTATSLPGGPTPSGTSSRPGGPLSATVTDRANGHTIRLRHGEVLRVVLSSTYWKFQNDSNTAVLLPVGGPKIRPQPSGCVPGGGCGTATATYRAVAAGRARVIATRTSCGEAMGCTAASGRFALNVVVT